MRQMLVVKQQIVNMTFRCAIAQKVRHFFGWVEVLPLLIRDARIGGQVADGKLRRVQIGDAFEQVFCDPQVGDPSCHVASLSEGIILPGVKVCFERYATINEIMGIG